MKYVENDDHQRQDQNKCCENPKERANPGGFTEEEATLDLGCEGGWHFDKGRCGVGYVCEPGGGLDHSSLIHRCLSSLTQTPG